MTTTTTYLTAWRALSARIRGIESAAAVHARFLAVNSSSPYGADKYLQQHCESVLQGIEQFQLLFGAVLPKAAHETIDEFKKCVGTQIQQNVNGDAKRTRTIVVKLIAFESELTYVLDDPTERLRSASELAFLHLQRLIVADRDYKEKWTKAFNEHETQCEKLGGVHLLWHGIWAFKVDAAGERTDLVYREPLSSNMASVGLGLVLTEWKRAVEKAGNSFESARNQAKMYSKGALAGVELTTHRYIIVVTNEQVTPPDDILDGSVTYRHINIAVDPRSPSVAATAMTKGKNP